MKKWRLLSLFTLLTLFLTGCGEPYLSTLNPAGEVAQSQYDLMVLSTAIMVLVIAVVVIIFAIVLLLFRRKKDEENKIPKQVEGSHKLEIIWTTIPIILLLILAVPTVIDTFRLADVEAMEKKDKDGNREALVVNVRANLYWWEFEYPDLKITTAQDLVVPTDEKVFFNLKASDVKHSFWIPAVGGKMDTNTDNENKFYLVFDSKKAKEANNLFYGKCAELCGPSHALMDFKVRAIPREEFDQWVVAMQNAEDRTPQNDLAAKGEQVFTEKGCIGCHAVSPAQSGGVGPNLSDFGDRSRVAGILEHNEENLRAWLENPEEIKPGNKMTNTYDPLTSDELDAIIEYLMGLKVQQ